MSSNSKAVRLINVGSSDVYLIRIDDPMIESKINMSHRSDLSWRKLVDQYESTDLNLIKLKASTRLNSTEVTSYDPTFIPSVNSQNGTNFNSSCLKSTGKGLIVILWNNIDPSIQSEVNPDTIIRFNRSGILSSIDRNDLIVQSVNLSPIESVNSYRIFNDTPLTIANNTNNSKLEIWSYSTDANEINDLMTIYPSDPIEEGIKVIPMFSNRAINVAQSDSPNTLIAIWVSQLGALPVSGQRACIASIIDSSNFKVIDYLVNSSKILVNQSGSPSTEVIWKVADNKLNFNGQAGDRCNNNSDCNSSNCVISGVDQDRIGVCYPINATNTDLLANGKICGTNDSCASGNCYKSVCRPVVYITSNTSNNSNGVKWWVWFSIIALVILAIIIMVVLINHSSNNNFITEGIPYEYNIIYKGVILYRN